MTTDTFDLVIVGGGPAGLAAAAEAGRFGLSVAIIDSQQEPGGQIYRAAERRASESDVEATHGAKLVRAARQAGMTWLGGWSVWQITPRLEILASDGTTSRRIQAARLLLATGAHERPMPIPGWTLPGVMTAGAGQILLKSAKTVPSGQTWLAGSGPLLMLLAWQWLKAGVKIQGILDTTPRANLTRAFSHLPQAIRAWPELLRGARWRLALARAGVKWHRVDGDLAASGSGKLETVTWREKGQTFTAQADALFLHQGVIPHSRLFQSMGGSMAWDEVQRCFAPVVDQWCMSSIPGVAVAGDSSGIAGAIAAELTGYLVGLKFAHELGRLDENRLEELSAPYRKKLERQLVLRPFLNTLFRPSDQWVAPTDEALVVCRCECVTAGQIRGAIQDGARSALDVKLATRCAMGPCQGRQCASTLQEVVRKELGHQPEVLRVRAPVEPLSVGELAGLSKD